MDMRIKLSASFAFVASALVEVPQHRDVAAAQHHHGSGHARQPVLPQPADPDRHDQLVERGAPPDARLQRRLLHLRRRRHVRQQPQDEHLPVVGAPLLRHRVFRHQVCVVCKLNIRNLVLENLFILRLMLRSPPILAGKRNWARNFHRTSKTRFMRFSLQSIPGKDLGSLKL